MAGNADWRNDPASCHSARMEQIETTGFDIGTVLELAGERAVPGGRVLARAEGKIVLVAGALPGERVRARITRDEKRWSEAEVVEVLEANPRRRAAPCPHADACGGCDWQFAERDLQLEMKREIVLDCFRRIGGLDVEDRLEGPEPIGDEFGVRQRIGLTFDPAGRPGLLARGSHDAVPIESCLLMRRELNEVVLPWLRLAPPWKRVNVRIDSAGRSVLLFETGDPPSEKDRKRYGKITAAMDRPPEIVGLLADRIPLAGERELRYEVAGSELTADAASFFQGSLPGAERLVEIVREMIGDDRNGQLLDLYSGVGLFAVCLGRGFSRVIAAESDGRAARHLKRNLKRNGIRGEARAEPALVTLRTAPVAERETIIVDPPRAGLDKEARRALVGREPARIVSISCDPATAARDTAVFLRAGYRLERIVAVDLFPVTAHVETVALLVREDVAGGDQGATAP
ncbi:MAG: RsmD family RNA methyltransferase [bacterium]